MKKYYFVVSILISYNSSILFYNSIENTFYKVHFDIALHQIKNLISMKLLFSLLFILICVSISAQGNLNGQTIKGSIVDRQSQITIPGVTVTILGIDPPIRTLTDAQGNYKIENIAAGRYDVQINFMGYKQITIPNVVVTSGKEVSLDIALEENITNVNEVIVSGNKKNETINELSSVSARSFSTEEVNRFAGSRSDPSRMVANFAGTSSPNDSRNDIVVRGNSPTGVLWRIEGLNIPNPNHFSTIGTTGGPVSALNTNLLKNSDFFTSAFPAEYGNANAGVFDLGFRKGNSDKREHTFQLGALTGIEAMTEGPINKTKGSSYLVSYRYSFTGVAQKIGIPIGTTATPFYQDISFKLTSGESKFGRFVLFGIGGISKITFDHTKIDSNDLFAYPNRDSYFNSQVGLVGLSHFKRVNEKSYFKTIIGATLSGSSYLEDTIQKTTQNITRVIENTTQQLRYSINSSYNSKINAKLFVKAGIIEELISLKLNYKNRTFTPDWQQIWDFNDYTSLLQGYAQAKYSFSNKATLNIGLHSQYLTLNKSISVEPRIGFKYQLNPKNILSLGVGLHSQMQPLDVYFYRTQLIDNSYIQSNKDLDFTKSMHYVLGYDLYPSKDWRVKIETYYQYIYDVPVTTNPSSYSMLNSGASFLPNESSYLINKGTGENYGLELTIEKFFSKGYYGLMTGSLYESKFNGSDGIEHNTAFNGRYVYNILLGKEFKIGKEKRHRFTIDVKMTEAGGRYFTPLDLKASQLAGQQVEKGDDYAFSERNPNFYRFDVKFGLVLNSNKRKISQSWFFDIQNVTNHKNVFAQRYNPVNNSINTAYQIGFFPNFVYKLQF